MQNYFIRSFIAIGQVEVSFHIAERDNKVYVLLMKSLSLQGNRAIN